MLRPQVETKSRFEVFGWPSFQAPDEGVHRKRLIQIKTNPVQGQEVPEGWKARIRILMDQVFRCRLT